MPFAHRAVRLAAVPPSKFAILHKVPRSAEQKRFELRQLARRENPPWTSPKSKEHHATEWDPTPRWYRHLSAQGLANQALMRKL